MIRGLLFVGYLLIRFLEGDLRLGWRKWRQYNHPQDGVLLRSAVSAVMRREARRVLRTAEALTGFRLTTESTLQEPLPKSFILVSNHQSLLDIPMLIMGIPECSLNFIAKHSLKHHLPLVSKCLRYGGSALIQRPRKQTKAVQVRAMLRDIRRFASLVKEGYTPVVFPEGTRSKDGTVHRFYTGGLATVLAEQSVPLVTVALDGGSRLRGISGIARIGRTRYRVKLLSVYPPPMSKNELRGLTTRMHDEITSQIVKWGVRSTSLTGR